ncbi:MAG: transglycosylase SLT domain-containing protein [Bacteroidales bacterium]
MLEKTNRLKSTTTLLLLLLTIVIVVGCSSSKAKKEKIDVYDIEQIVESGELKVLTIYSSTSYFNYRGEEMGYEYELAKEFATSLGVELKVVVAENVTRLKEMLIAGEGDLIAYTIPVTQSDTSQMIFCGRKTENFQVLVQRQERRKKEINDVTQLIGKEVNILKGSRYEERLINLNSELGGGIEIVHIDQDTITTEDLIEMVSMGRIDFTVADSEIAQLNKTYFNNIDVSLKISFPQRLSWATRNTPKLAEALDEWFANKQISTKNQAIAKRYFENSKRSPQGHILDLKANKISNIDNLFKLYSNSSKFDWRLLAAIAYKESGFDSTVVSWAGAIGVMQIMPATGRAMKANPRELHKNSVNIETSIKILSSIDNSLSKVKDPIQKLKLTLAAYNAGIGHLKDAQALAQKYGHDPHKYDNSVEEYILLKRLPEYYSDPVCRSGYLRGNETHKYVREVYEQYQLYKNRIK